jgi:hypothetical protein
MSVTIDLAAGEVRLADAVLSGIADASAVVPGALRVGDEGVVRPIGYAARATLCALHATPAVLGRAVLEASADGIASGTPAMEALALHLAGADAAGTMPGFSDVAYVMARVFGWGPDQLAASPARWVDGMAASAMRDEIEEDRDDGWTRIRLAGASDDPEAGGVSALRDRLAADLLLRAGAALAAGHAARAATPADDPALGEVRSRSGRSGPDAAGDAVGEDLPSAWSGRAGPTDRFGPSANGSARPAGVPTPRLDRAAADARPAPGSAGVLPLPARQAGPRSERPMEPSRGSTGQPPSGEPADAVLRSDDRVGSPSPVRLSIEGGGASVGPSGTLDGVDADDPMRSAPPRTSLARSLRGPLAARPMRATVPASTNPIERHVSGLPAPADPIAIHRLADGLAEALEDEADLRGIFR